MARLDQYSARKMSRAASTVASLLIAVLVLSIRPAAGREPASTSSLEVIGTLFRVTTPSGRVLTSPDLVGAVFRATDETDRVMTVRIDAVSPDPSDADGEVWLHHLSVLDTAAGTWNDLCTRGSDGKAAGFPLAGRWAADGRYLREPSRFTLTCTTGAIGKCVRFGYKPWREPLWDYHQACVRMIRADYGGDGGGHTRDRTTVEIFDRLSIQRPDPDPGGLTFEAAWGPGGAVCVRRTRVPELLSPNELALRYPHLAGKIGPSCSEATPALIWNRS